MLGYLFTTLRLSLGDYDFSASNYLTVEENHLYWILWFLVLVITNIIFLNFIIAEASASYESVKSRLDAMIYKEKASLIAEAEDMYLTSLKSEKNFPKYIIIREIQN
uniref:Ion transport domain-containing protein n=1 Tax=Strombidium rassoulzadegani TaxID=1082188 RepID=A0A7S3FXQ9_9SPIT|mmetsp:Transcript_7970/g.13370  ORF Transcript_7970/g.13370 Transcript_7970/m.13370 type:complete len:107 (+) Transcript_7970:291-611(+)